MKTNPGLTFCDFLDNVKNLSGETHSNAVDLMGEFAQRPDHNNFYPDEVLLLIDYVKHCFLMISGINSFLGYTRTQLLEAGPSFLYSIRHPEDFRIFNQKIFPTNMSFIKDHSAENISAFTFTTNYRLKSRAGTWLSVSHRSRFLKYLPDGTPLVSLDFLSDISHFKKDDQIINIIEKTQGGQRSSKQLVSTFHPGEDESRISKREMIVLQCICDGFSSKQIAEKLHISIHTINNHRKNMLGKTKCKNLSELVARASRTGIL
ncbi:response regulator transcription factor [Flavihumibacter sp. R14]|nr:response regulator transcription factor [Flavihumibacter soli]